jgi:hypothetical protein
MREKDKKGTTRRGFVKEIAAGTTAVAVAGSFAVADPAPPPPAKESNSLEDRLDALEKRLQQVEDIQAINRLQYAYNYYVEHMMKQEIIDCFSDSPDVLLNWLEGKWKGKAGVQKYFDVNQVPPVGFQHQLMPTAGLITVAPDGKSAKGRWYAFGAIMMSRPSQGQPQAKRQPSSVSRSFVNGIYEMGYIKEEGIWKILTIDWYIPYSVTIPNGWRMPEDIGGPMVKASQSSSGQFPQMKPDIPIDKNDLRYISGYILPYHFKHPVTGKPSSEAKRNARLKPLEF